MTAAEIHAALREVGICHVRGLLTTADYQQLAAALGNVVAEETIELRPDAHAYVAKPGAVPFHTDHPQVAIIGWYCVEQDADDGTSMFVDARPVVAAMKVEERDVLRRVELHCPPLHGGAPTGRWPVLRRDGEYDAVFCSPWLHSATPLPDHDGALADFRRRLSAATKAAREVRLGPGDAVFIDNRRVLHGRRAIAPSSKRRLLRRWIRLQ